MKIACLLVSLVGFTKMDVTLTEQGVETQFWFQGKQLIQVHEVADEQACLLRSWIMVDEIVVHHLWDGRVMP